jgi:hypothetical protein
LGSSERIWDTVAHRATDRVRERTSAARAIDRKPVTITLGGCELVQTAWKAPQLGNANGGEILIYPGFVLYRVTNEAYALLDVRDVEIQYEPVAFVEQEAVPGDCRVIEHTWAKVNKDGSRDRRFADNYQIPVVAYGRLEVSSSTGLQEEYMVSNAPAAAAFAAAWAEFRDQLPPMTA